MDYKKHILESFVNAELKKSKIDANILSLQGMTGIYTRHFYNNLLNFEDARYLEIGVWKGSSVCAAMYRNKANVVCIDNWTEFGGPKQEFISNFEKFRGENTAKFIESDCFKVDTSTLGKFNIYLYDGNHSYDSHYKALNYFKENLDDMFIYIVDDWNLLDIRNASLKAIEDNNFKMLFKIEKRTSNNNQHADMKIAQATWWNGIAIFLLQKI